MSSSLDALKKTQSWTKDPEFSSWLQGVYKEDLGRDLGAEGLEYWGGDRRGEDSSYHKGAGLTTGGNAATLQSIRDNIRRSDEYKTYQAGKGSDDDDDDDNDGGGGGGGGNGGGDDTGGGNADINIGGFSKTLPEYEINNNMDAATSYGNRLIDHYTMRFLPEWKKSTNLAIDEGTAGLGFHANRAFTLDADGTPKARFAIPEAEDPKDMFDYYYNKLYGDNKSGNSGVTIDDLNKKIDSLTKQLNDAKLLSNA